jgi:hypothetical protein
MNYRWCWFIYFFFRENNFLLIFRRVPCSSENSPIIYTHWNVYIIFVQSSAARTRGKPKNVVLSRIVGEQKIIRPYVSEQRHVMSVLAVEASEQRGKGVEMHSTNRDFRDGHFHQEGNPSALSYQRRILSRRWASTSRRWRRNAPSKWILKTRISKHALLRWHMLWRDGL